MPNRVASPNVPTTLKMRDLEPASKAKTPALPQPSLPDDGGGFDAPRKKPVNMTGRQKPVTRAPVAVKPEDAQSMKAEIDVNRMMGNPMVGKKSAPIIQTEGRLSAKAPYDQLPKDLKSKLSEKVWVGLPEKQRDTLIATYSRLKGWGVWDHVKTVKRELEPTEAHAHVAGMEFEVAGNAGGVVFEAKDAEKFKKALVDTGHFGEDEGAMGAMHPGQASMREWTEDKGSLHVSIGPGNQFDAHLDKESPVAQPKNGKTVLDLKKGPMHHSRELWPELIRKFTGIPGVIVDANVKPGSRDGGPEVTGMVSIVLHGPVKSDRKKVQAEPPAGDPGPEGVIDAAVAHLDLSKVQVPRPKGVKPGDAADPKVLAEAMAALMLDAARTGKTSIKLDFVEYAHQKGYQQPLAGELHRLGFEVRQQLEAALAKLPPDERALYDLSKVKTLEVGFGVKGQGATVQLTQSGRTTVK